MCAGCGSASGGERLSEGLSLGVIGMGAGSKVPTALPEFAGRWADIASFPGGSPGLAEVPWRPPIESTEDC